MSEKESMGPSKEDGAQFITNYDRLRSDDSLTDISTENVAEKDTITQTAIATSTPNLPV